MADLPDVFLIVLDTVRRDFLPVYGGPARMPNLEALARDSVVFPNAIAPSPWTIPSHVSMISGLYPREHGVHEDEDGTDRISERMRGYGGPNIVERLRRRGYNTVGLTANLLVGPGTGFDRWFNAFTGWGHLEPPGVDGSILHEATDFGKNVTEIALNLLKRGDLRRLLRYYSAYRRLRRAYRQHGYPTMKAARAIVDAFTSSSFERPLFAFMNFMEAHEPVADWEINKWIAIYRVTDVLSEGSLLTESMMQAVRSGYVRALEVMDGQLGRLLDHLRRSGLYDESLIIVTSDHGQAMKEPRKYPFYGHGDFLYPELVEVPLIVKFPGNSRVDVGEGYQSLIKIPDLINGVIEGYREDLLTEELAFSEAFGNMLNLSKWFEDGTLPRHLEPKAHEILHPRKAVYKGGYRLVVDGLNGEVEEFSREGRDLSPSENGEVLRDMLSELELFRGTEKFAVPKL
ncbi:MAG: sulfatase [Conexivisphaera sp.]